MIAIKMTGLFLKPVLIDPEYAFGVDYMYSAEVTRVYYTELGESDESVRLIPNDAPTYVGFTIVNVAREFREIGKFSQDLGEV